jgi:cation diffusion facilitator family transporter
VPPTPEAGPSRSSLNGAAKTALVSVAAAAVLIAIKLAAGLGANSLALISEAVHSGADLVAALLAFFALQMAGRPADADHPYGHGKAEHLSALIEGMMLVFASVIIIVEAITRLTGPSSTVTTSPWVFLVVGIVLCVDAARATTSRRASRRHNSAALAAGAVHFASDMAGTVAVLVGLILVGAGYPDADAIAALAVAVLVLVASGTLLRRNADILLDRASLDDVAAARTAVEALGDLEIRRLRLRSAAGRHFADIVVAMPPGAALAQAHAVADRVEEALDLVLPGVDAVVHVEPGRGSLTEQVRAAAQSIAQVREVHNVQLLDLDGHTEAILHLKLPADTPLAGADATAHQVQQAVRQQVPEITAVHTHLEPLIDSHAGHSADDAASAEALEAIRKSIAAAIGSAPSSVRLVDVDAGLVAFVELTLSGEMSLDAAHAVAARARRAGRQAHPVLADVFVQTTSAHVA